MNMHERTVVQSKVLNTVGSTKAGLARVDSKICDDRTQPKRVQTGTSEASGIRPIAVRARSFPEKVRSWGSCMASTYRRCIAVYVGKDVSRRADIQEWLLYIDDEDQHVEPAAKARERTGELYRTL